MENREGSDLFLTGDLDSEVTVKLHKQVTGSRKKDISFHAVQDWQKDIWKRGGEVTKLFQKSKFLSSKGEAGKQNSLILVNAETFPNKLAFQSSDAPKQEPELSEELKAYISLGCIAISM